MGLTGKQDLFAREYLKDLNAAAAARRAGYAPGSSDVEGTRLLSNPKVQARIAELAAERNEELKIDAREVLRELYRIATADPAELIDENHVPHNLNDIPIDLRRTIASVEIEELFEGRGEARERTGRLHKIKFWNKNQALEALGRHLALFKDSLALTGPNGEPLQLGDMQVCAKLATIFEEARRRRDAELDGIV